MGGNTIVMIELHYFHLCVLCVGLMQLQITSGQSTPYYDNYDHCDVSKCIDEDGNVCGNHGNCICETCECMDEFSGSLCLDERFEDVCKKYRNCVRCKIYNLGPLTDEECSVCDETAEFIVAESLTFTEIPCIFVDSDTGCLESFEANTSSDNKIQITVLRDLKCILYKPDTTDVNATPEWPGSRRGDSDVETIYSTPSEQSVTADSVASSKDSGASVMNVETTLVALISICSSMFYFKY